VNRTIKAPQNIEGFFRHSRSRLRRDRDLRGFSSEGTAASESMVICLLAQRHAGVKEGVGEVGNQVDQDDEHGET
jgi:hypothetical protein